MIPFRDRTGLEDRALGQPMTGLAGRKSYRKTVALYDVDSRIPNLALMKLSAWHKARGGRVRLVRHSGEAISADAHFAATIFHRTASIRRIAALRESIGDSLVVGGTGGDLRTRLPPGAERMFPDYSLYGHSRYAIGFLTRGCVCHCPFCLVPRKEGRLRRCSGGFDAFVPRGQKQVMLLDNNLLAHPDADEMLREAVRRDYAVNFSQSLDIAYLTAPLFDILRQVDSRNARFTRRQFYFSVNGTSDIARFEEARTWLRSLGKDAVSVILLYGYNTHLSEDYARMLMLRRLRLIPFFQEYWPLPGLSARHPDDFFDMDLREVIRLTFRSNGYNWEKYLRWLNRLYFQTFGRYYRPLVEIIYRYNNKERITRYLQRPEFLTTELYRRHSYDARVLVNVV